MIATYIFDLDDTIIDSSIYSRMYNRVIEELLSKLNIKEIELQEVINKIKAETGKTKPDTYEICKKLNATEIYYSVLERYVRHTYTLKNSSIPSIFKKIKQKKKQLGIISNSEKRTVEIFLKRFSLHNLVDFIESGKKDTILFWVTLERKYDIKKEATLIIDDSDKILEVAEHSGYKTLNVKDLSNLDQFEY